MARDIGKFCYAAPTSWTPISGGNLASSLATCVSIGYTRRAMIKDVGFRIRIDRTLRARFLAVCRDRDKPAAQVLREFMQEYIATHNAANDTESGGRRRPLAKAGK